MRHQSSLAVELDDLASALESLDLQDRGAGFANLSANRDGLVRSIRSYAIPRLSDDAGPLLVVFAGPTGSGKSTLVNSLAGLEFSETGPLRPTTTGPVVLAGRRHVSEFGSISGIECEVVGGRAPILSSIALVDTPDLDSTSLENRTKAEILIDNADVVVFVTSAIRYADLVPWEVLRRASSRGASVITVINRLGAGSSGAVTDFRSRLTRAGLDADVVRVPEHHVQPHRHRLPGLAVRELQRSILASTTEIIDDRRLVVDRVVRSTAAQVFELAEELESLLESTAREGEAKTTMEDAVRLLDLTPLCEGLRPSHPPEGAIAGLIWEWRNRLSEDAWREVATTIERRLIAMVEGHMRQTVAHGEGPVADMSPEIVKELRSRTSSVAHEWLASVEDLCTGRRFSGRLATQVLADCAVIESRTPAFDRMFEDGSLIVRAQRALVEPLERVYDWVGSQMRDRKSAGPSREEPERLRQLASAVSARSHFADA